MTRTVPSPRGGTRGEVRRLALLLTLACWLVYLSTAGGTLGSGDAVAMFEEAKAIVDRGALDVPPTQSTEQWRGPDGRYYTPFGIGQPLYDVPFLLAGRALTRLAPMRLGDADAVPKAAVALGSTVTSACTVGLTFLLAYRLSNDLGGSLLAALALAFGTLVWPYSKFGFSAALATCALSVGVWGYAEGVAESRARVLGLGGAGFGVALMTRHELVIASAVAVGWAAWHCRNAPRRGALLTAGTLGIAVGIALTALHNWLRFGTPLWSGYAPGISGGGVLGLLASPTGAFLLYSPVAIAVVALVGRARVGDSAAWLSIGVALSLFTFYASLDDWLGTRSYGPRYLVPLLPLLVAPLSVWWTAASRLGRRTILALVVGSVLLQVPAVALDFTRVGIEAEQPPQNARLYSWHWAPIRLNAVAFGPAVRRNIAYLTGAPTPRLSAGNLQSRVAFSLDFWWLYLYYLHIVSKSAALAAGTLPMVAATLLLVVAVRRVRRQPRALAT